MPATRHGLFTDEFCSALRALVELHHSLYQRIPPQGIFFESLVERAFLKTGWARDQVVATPLNSPSHDLTVGTTKISVKTERGASTRQNAISITKLCTTETGEWTSRALVEHAIRHLEKYEHILMLRAIWGDSSIHYQLLDIPLKLLRRIAPSDRASRWQTKGPAKLGRRCAS